MDFCFVLSLLFWAPAQVTSIGSSMVVSLVCFFFQFRDGKIDVSADYFSFTGSWMVTFAGDFSGVAEVDFWVVSDFVFLFFTTSVHSSCLSPGPSVDTPFGFSIGSFGGTSTFLWGQSLVMCPNCLQSQHWGRWPSMKTIICRPSQTHSSSSRQGRSSLRFLCQPCLRWGWLLQPSQVQLFQTWVDLGAMAVKDYSAFPKTPELLELHH